MKRIITAAFALALATSAFAADGAAIYASKCAACHGKTGEGTKMAPNPIAGASADAVKDAITKGKGKMKPQKVEAGDVDAVASYVAGLKK